MSDLEVVTFRPEPDQYAWTFGGVSPVARIRTPVVLDVFTEDAFVGRVRGENDLVSQVCEFPFVNPQTGPVLRRGRRAGRHRSPCTSSRSSRPGTGARRPPSRSSARSPPPTLTALLHEPLPELVWIWQLDRGGDDLPVRGPAR